MLWDQKRKSKIAQLRDSFEAAKLEDCTFKPLRPMSSINTSRSRANKLYNKQNFTNQKYDSGKEFGNNQAEIHKKFSTIQVGSSS